MVEVAGFHGAAVGREKSRKPGFDSSGGGLEHVLFYRGGGSAGPTGGSGHHVDGHAWGPLCAPDDARVATI